MELSNVRIFSERVTLRTISMRYREAVFSEFTEEIAAYMIHVPAQDIAETEALISNSINNIRRKTDLELVILKQGTGEFLGCVSLLKLDSKTPTFRIWLRKAAHGHHYGLEAVAAVKRWADKNVEYRTLLYPVDKANIPSRKIPENLGGVAIREYNLLSLGGKILNVLEYAIPNYIRVSISGHQFNALTRSSSVPLSAVV